MSRAGRSEIKRKARIRAAQPEQHRANVERREQQRIAELILTSDPDDHRIGVAHGFDIEANDYDETCRNGCGLTFGDIVGGKVRQCMAADHSATRAVEAAESAALSDIRGLLLG